MNTPTTAAKSAAQEARRRTSALDLRWLDADRRPVFLGLRVIAVLLLTPPRIRAGEGREKAGLTCAHPATILRKDSLRRNVQQLQLVVGSIGGRFEAVTEQTALLVALVLYLLLATLALALVVASLLLGDLLDSFESLSVGGEGTSSAIGIGLIVFALGGALAIFLGASAFTSVLWAAAFGALTFLLALGMMRWIETNQTSSALSVERVLGAQGLWKLTLSEEAGCRRGLVEVYIGSSREELRAWSTASLNEGDKVRVVAAESARDVEVEPV
jgi:MFS family permease